jgi:hypothetical protein
MYNRSGGTIMRAIGMLTLGVAMIVGTAWAQTNPPASDRPNNPAVNTTGTNNTNTPVRGANSFTEGEAKSRMESHGYSQVSDLKKDNDGIWRGKAMKDGKSVSVSLDFQGNVISR